MATGAAARRLSGLFRPAASLLGRLRYAQKFAVVGLVLLVPLVFVAGAYIDLQRDQIAFSAKERRGVVLMTPLVELTGAVVEARHRVAAGRADSTAVDPLLDSVDALNRRIGASLDTDAEWTATRRLVITAQWAGSAAAYNDAVDALLALIVRVGDESNLTLDPDIDSYYLMDTLQFRLPALLDIVGRAADRAGSDAAGTALELSLYNGVITDLRKALARASDAVVTSTASASVRANARTGFDRLEATARTLGDALTAGTVEGRFSDVAAPAALVRQEATAFAAYVATALDGLLRTRISGYTARALRVGLGSGAAAVLALYLFVGFYLSVARPIRRIVDTLDAVAHGDLARRVPVETRDELGFVARALNDTVARTEAATQRLSNRATSDPLTGLPNRAYVLGRLAEALDRCAGGDELLCVIFVDLDGFKVINDSLGHEAGDEVLCDISARLTSIKRKGDTVARLAGDEFVVICEDLMSVDAAILVAERIVTCVSEPVVVHAGASLREVRVGASVGLAVADGSTRPEPADLLRDADAAMYEAKQRGRGRVEIFDDRLRAAVQQRHAVRDELRQGIEAGEIHAHYQPIVSVPTGRVVGFEALARWQNPARGTLSAVDFIDVAENSGLVVPLGTTVLRTACQQMAVWRAEHPDLYLAVNVSGAQFSDPGFVDTVAGVLAEAGLDPDALWLEITETSLMADAEAARAILARVRGLGVHVAIDDFGTGYSSLAYLRRFPVEVLKVDKTFVARIGDGSENEAIIAMIVALARTLGLTVIAEGVETPEQFECLKQLGCDVAQGYLLARPAPAGEAWFGAPAAVDA